MKKHKEYFRVLVELSKAEAELFKMRSGVGDYELLHLETHEAYKGFRSLQDF